MKFFKFKSIIRFIILSWNYKLGFLSILLKYFCYFPIFNYKVERIPDIIKDGISSKGHIEPGKKIQIKIFNFVILKFNLQKGETLTAEHFYFHRSLKDIKFFLNNSKKIININKDSIIFDPACGTGKHLLYLTDRFNCKGIGFDIYPKAINITKKIEKFSNCLFLHGNSCDSKTLKNLSNYYDPKKIDVLFINSWVQHVYKNKEFEEFLNYIKKTKCKIMLIETKKINLMQIFKTKKVLFQKYKNEAQYVILEL